MAGEGKKFYLWCNGTPFISSDVSQKDRGYAWVIMVACFMSRVINSNGRAMSGVLLLELENSFHATEVELNAASTTQSCITLGACK